MDMDMDVAWCLTCAKRTRDSRHPYCSDECRLRDTGTSAPATLSPSLTSALPPLFTPTPPRPSANTSRPTISPFIRPLPPASLSAVTSPKQLRDRRAFSFPATQPPDPATIAQKRAARQSSNVLPPFVRRPNALLLTSPTFHSTPEGQPRPVLAKMSKSTGGANTPFEPDSVFCSTSESSFNEANHDISPIKLIATSVVPKASPPAPQPGPSDSRYSSLSTARHRDLSPRRTSQSPVAALVASSASSRSREDILSWARSINVQAAGERRGRSRTRRQEVLARITPPSEEPLDDLEEKAGTTPKGLSGALAGLTIGGFGMAPIVKAFTSVTSSTGLGLQAVPAIPAPAEVSLVAAIASTTPVFRAGTEIPPMPFGGATPTLSTISYSEVVDPDSSVVTDNAEVAMADDISQPSYSSSRRDSMLSKNPPALKTPRPQVPKANAGTINALWNLSNYLRQMAPFSITSVLGTHSPATEDPVICAPTSDTPTPPRPSATPVPTSRMQETPSSPPKEFVRSLPMNIVLQSTDQQQRAEQRQRERQAREQLEQSSRRRSTSGKGNRRSTSPSRERLARQTSYDADADAGASEEEVEVEDDARRGRSRRGKVLARDVPGLTTRG
ncbi:hypothetical protein BCR39DRAFT_196813 [Naematelia encephala]|uniref:Uncharacterized protein n=1 Tax=Naematelia encephala TaxID=71784 RepID=A0A1Y2BIE0_9TREE|nr:hypothetical protein BCR39DRAFT_196813 [Naematelia encephala]